ncbi:MAG TPA: tetratricopeptide repeat protein [Steroidobacteraceae bacterium]|nr:tetratricopeptide repeat protein [Steroidobacteraceae bacterium]
MKRALAAALSLIAVTGCERGPPTGPAATPAPQIATTYVGAAKCAGCHAKETALWQHSHHALAMQPANATTMLGNFEHASFVKDGVKSEFFTRDGHYFVRTDGSDGKLADFEITYTFGVDPLQQYLVAFPDGRLQALGIAWDTRAKEQGGQRWFHLYPDEKIDHRDVLHWTRTSQNWNHQCAECHSTNLQKNYHADTRRFDTTWSDVNVACEACHGPASRHVAWAENGKSKDEPNHGLVFRLADHASAGWAFQDGNPIARRATPLTAPTEVETCGRCHSRRAELWPEYHFGELLEQTHRVALLDEGLYFADGQMRDEVYEYGSLLQSRMYAAGVTCSDCHEPHSSKLRAAGNALCAQCHQATHFDTPEHYHHPAGSAGAQCVSCHMVERTYMVVDGRRDHSFRVPRPDLSASLGTPNACNGCHDKNDARWAAEAIAKWFPNGRQHTPHYAQAIQAARTSGTDAEGLLRLTAEAAGQPAIVRATALSLMASYLSAQSATTIQNSLRDSDALVRRAATESAVGLEPTNRIAAVAPLLRDPVRTVRLQALDDLLDVPRAQLSPADQQSFDAVIAEHRAINLANADRAESQVNTGTFESRLGNVAAAQKAFATAMELEPSFVPSYVNLADLYRAQGQEAQAEATLRAGIKVEPRVAELHHALGLALVRQKRLPDAMKELALATQLQPESVRYAYVFAIATHESGNLPGAIKILTAARQRHPASRELVTALFQYSLERGDVDGARHWAQELGKLFPDDQQVRQLIQQLGGT